jgi:hypothetical protein
MDVLQRIALQVINQWENNTARERVKSIKIQSNILATTPINKNRRFSKRAEV